jgi:PAS domain S-box-containing protein
VNEGERGQRALRVRHALGVFFEATRAPVIALREDGAFVSANEAALAQYGYALEEFVRMRIHDLIAAPRPELAEDLAHAMRGDAAPLERRQHRRKDGSTLWVVPTAGPVEVDGERLIVSVLKDVSALVGAEERAHQQQETVQIVWEAAVERHGRGFALLDEDRRVQRTNGTLASWLRMREDEIVGRRCDEMFHTMCRTQPCPHAVAAVEQRHVVMEFLSSRSGRPLRVEVWPAPANDAGIATVHVVHDLSEERAIRSRLLAADRLGSLGRVAAGVAHEVNNPAGFVTLALPLIREQIGRGRSDQAVALLEEAGAAMVQIKEIMNDLTGLARDRSRALVDLAGLASGVIRIAAYETQQRARVERRFEDGVLVEVRAARLSQVLLNLLLNAAQAIPPGAPERHHIEVRTRQDGDRAILEVADTGPGITPAVGERLFEPFFTTRGDAGGTGLGLWLSKSIVEEEGGTLTWSNRPEGGACFTVSLPALDAAQPAPRPPQPHA